jgi:hypothetical protein
MKIPNARFKQGDLVRTDHYGDGRIIGRSFDNLLHAKEWKYTIEWQDGQITHHHYCNDLVRISQRR